MNNVRSTMERSSESCSHSAFAAPSAARSTNDASTKLEKSSRRLPTASQLPVFIDLTQISDDEGDEVELSNGDSNDSDLEIISLRSQSPVTISTPTELVPVGSSMAANTETTGADLSVLELSTPIQTPSEHDFSSLYQNSTNQTNGPLTPVTRSRPRVTNDSTAALSPSSPSIVVQRSREDLIDWLRDIEPFDPQNVPGPSSPAASRTASMTRQSGLLNTAPRNPVQCRHCGHPFHIESSAAGPGHPSTSRGIIGNCMHVGSNNDRRADNGVLERMLSTPPLPAFDEQQHLPNAIQPQPTLRNSRVNQWIQQNMPMDLSIVPIPVRSGRAAPTPSSSTSAFANTPRDIRQPMFNATNMLDNRHPVPAHSHISSNYPYPIPVALSSSLYPNFSFSSPSQVSNHPSQPLSPPVYFSQPLMNPQVFGNPFIHPSMIEPNNSQHLDPAPPFLPLVQGLYPDFPGFGLSPNQIEKHTTKYMLSNSSDSDVPVTKKMKHAYSDEREASCSVCLDGFEDGQTLRRLACEHLFHADCVDEWLKRRPTCPNCRVDVRRSPHEQISTGSAPSTSNHRSGGADSGADVRARLHRFFRRSRFHRSHVPQQGMWPFGGNH